MKNEKWSESEILKVLKEYQSGSSAKELSRQDRSYHQTLLPKGTKYVYVKLVDENRFLVC